MTKYLFIFSLLLFSFTSSTFDYIKLKDASECKKKIKEKSGSTNTLYATFSENKFSSLFNNPKSGKGEIYFKKKDKIRWEHTSPISQIILIDGKSIKYQEDKKELNNVTTTKIVKKIQSLMVNLISGDFLNEKDFAIEYLSNQLNYKLILRPTSSKLSKYIQKVELVFDIKNLALKEMTLEETATEKVVYGFSNVSFNKTIEDNKFTKF